MPLDTDTKKVLITDNARSDGDTGSPEVQIALLQTRINDLTEHLKIHKKDFASLRGLRQLTGRRNRLLDYLMKEDIERYRAILAKYSIRHRKGGAA